MIKKAVFDNFRGFQHMELSDLGAVTLISGKNNSGKSSVLEGIFLALDYRAPDSFALLNDIRSISFTVTPTDLWDPLFHNLLPDREISIELGLGEQSLKLKYSRDDNYNPIAVLNEPAKSLQQIISSSRQMYSLKFNLSYGDYSENGHFVMATPTIQMIMEPGTVQAVPIPIVNYIHSSRTVNNNFISELFGTVVRNNKKEQLIEILKIIDESLNDITTVVSGNQPQLHANVHGQWLPLRLAGDGFDHLLFIVSSLIARPGSILLIDEIETGFHYSVYDKLWEAVMTVAREQKCQVIATTHSYECLESAVNQAKDTGIGDDFSYFRLGRNKKGETVAYRLSQDLLAHATDNALEVR